MGKYFYKDFAILQILCIKYRLGRDQMLLLTTFRVCLEYIYIYTNFLLNYVTMDVNINMNSPQTDEGNSSIFLMQITAPWCLLGFTVNMFFVTMIGKMIFKLVIITLKMCLLL